MARHQHNIPSDVLKVTDKTLPVWVETNAPATIFTDKMIKPKHGTLVLYQDKYRYFHTGRDIIRTPIKFNNLYQDVSHLIRASQLFWATLYSIPYLMQVDR